MTHNKKSSTLIPGDGMIQMWVPFFAQDPTHLNYPVNYTWPHAYFATLSKEWGIAHVSTKWHRILLIRVWLIEDEMQIDIKTER